MDEGEGLPKLMGRQYLSASMALPGLSMFRAESIEWGARMEARIWRASSWCGRRVVSAGETLVRRSFDDLCGLCRNPPQGRGTRGAYSASGLGRFRPRSPLFCPQGRPSPQRSLAKRPAQETHRTAGSRSRRACRGDIKRHAST